jgi:hypothetical protein
VVEAVRARFRPHLAIVGQYLSVDPALAYHALRFYAAAPSARAELGTPAAVERLHRLDVAPPPDPAGPHDELGMAWRARPGPDPRPSD